MEKSQPRLCLCNFSGFPHDGLTKRNSALLSGARQRVRRALDRAECNRKEKTRALPNPSHRSRWRALSVAEGEGHREEPASLLLLEEEAEGRLFPFSLFKITFTVTSPALPSPALSDPPHCPIHSECALAAAFARPGAHPPSPFLLRISQGHSCPPLGQLPRDAGTPSVHFLILICQGGNAFQSSPYSTAWQPSQETRQAEWQKRLKCVNLAQGLHHSVAKLSILVISKTSVRAFLCQKQLLPPWSSEEGVGIWPWLLAQPSCFPFEEGIKGRH